MLNTITSSPINNSIINSFNKYSNTKSTKFSNSWVKRMNYDNCTLVLYVLLNYAEVYTFKNKRRMNLPLTYKLANQ